MTIYGLQSTGFRRKTFQEILDTMLLKARATWGDTFATNQSSDDYKQFVNEAEEISELWEQLEKLFYNFFPDTSTGIALTRSCALVGVNKFLAKKSIVRGVELTNNTNNDVIIPTGTRVQQSTTGKIWELLFPITIPANDSNEGDFQCTEEGQNYCAINTLDTILDFIVGFDGVDNPNDVTIGDLGRLEETESELKLRRDIAISSPSSCSGVAISNKLREVSGVVYANYRENDSETTDINGLPPHSLEFFVLGGSNIDIAKCIATYKPASIKTHGGNTQVVTDSLGNSLTIKWSSLVQKDIYFRIDITTNGDWDNSYEQDIENLIISYVNNQHSFNETLYTWKYYTLLQNIIGVDSITIYQGYTSNPNTIANLTPSVNEKPYTTPSNFTFNIT